MVIKIAESLVFFYFFLQGHLKSPIREWLTESDMDLVARSPIVAGDIREMSLEFASITIQPI